MILVMVTTYPSSAGKGEVGTVGTATALTSDVVALGSAKNRGAAEGFSRYIDASLAGM